MRAVISRWTWAQIALLSVGALSSTACRTGTWGMPGAGLTSWGKKDGTSLAAAKPSPNFPTPPSASANPNAVTTAAAGSNAGRSGGANAGTPGSPGAAGNAALTTNPYSSTGSRTGGTGPTGGYGPGGYPSGTASAGGSTGGQADHGFYPSSPPGSNMAGSNMTGANAPASKWGNAGAGYAAGSTGMPRGGYDYQTADRRNELGAGSEGGYPATSYPGAQKPVAGAGAYGGPASAYGGATSGYSGGAGGYGSTGSYNSTAGGGPAAYANPYASPVSNTMPSRPAAYGGAGQEDDGHGHSEADYPSSGGYGSPPARSPGYDRGSSGYAPPDSTPTYGAPRGGFSSSNAPTSPAGLPQSGAGYVPGSTRRSVGSPSTAFASREPLVTPATGVKPVVFNAGEAAADDDSYSSGEGSSGGSFTEPGDSYPASPAARIGSASDSSYDSGFKR